MIIQDLKSRFEKALTNFQSKEQHIIQSDLGERSLSHKLAEYLQREFTEYNVDCEYNRNLNNVKRLQEIKEYVQEKRKSQLLSDFEEEHGINVIPDIIVHIRGTDDSNKIIIEVKKDGSGIEDVKFDLKKIEAYKSELNYELGVFVKIGKGKIEKKCF